MKDIKLITMTFVNGDCKVYVFTEHGQTSYTFGETALYSLVNCAKCFIKESLFYGDFDISELRINNININFAKETVSFGYEKFIRGGFSKCWEKGCFDSGEPYTRNCRDAFERTKELLEQNTVISWILE